MAKTQTKKKSTKKTIRKKKKPANLLAVFGKNPEQVQGFYEAHGCGYKLHPVNEPGDIEDIKKGGELICVGSYWERSDRHHIFAMAKSKGLTLVDEFDWMAARAKKRK